MKAYEPIAVSLFTILVLTASFLVGKSIGFNEGVSQGRHAAVNADNLQTLQTIE